MRKPKRACQDCGKPLPSFMIQQQTDRLRLRLVPPGAIEKVMPRCRRCLTAFLKKYGRNMVLLPREYYDDADLQRTVPCGAADNQSADGK
jgi:hypothetical protein